MNTSNFNELLECFKQTLSVDKSIRTEAENKLKQIEDKIPIFTEGLFEYIKTPSENEEIEHLKLSILIYLNRLLKKNLLNPEYKSENKIADIQKYVTSLLTPNLTKKIFSNLYDGFNEIINSTADVPTIAADLMKVIQIEIQNYSSNKLKGLIKILDSIVQSSVINKNNFNIFYSQAIEFSKMILGHLIEESKVVKNNEILYFEIVADFYQMLYAMIYITKKSFWKIENVKKEMPKVFEVFVLEGFKLMFSFMPNHQVISWTGNMDVDKAINLAQSKILKFINFEMNFFPQIISDQIINNNFSEILITFSEIMNTVINEKLSYINQMDVNDTNPVKTEKYGNYRYSTIISHILLFLNKFFLNDTFRKENSSKIIIIFKDIILPFLILTKNEENSCKNSEENYLTNVNDAIYDNKSKTIKSSSSLLFKTIFQKESEISIQITEYILGILTKLFGEPFSKENYSNEKVIILLSGDEERVIDLCLFVLCLILEVNPDENEKIELCLSKIKTVFIQISNKLLLQQHEVFVKHKICLFIKSFLSNGQCKEKEDIDMIRYLFSCLFNSDEPLINSEAAEVLSSIIYQNKKNRLLSQLSFIKEFLSQLGDKISKVQNDSFFDVLLQIIEINKDFDIWSNIFKNLCERVRFEIERNKRLKFFVNKDKKIISYNYKILINKCFNIIRLMTEDKNFVVKYITVIEVALNPLLEYMNKDIKKIDFDEDLVMIMTNLINHLEYIPNIALNFLKDLHKYATKNKGMLLDLYELCNSYIIYSNNIIESNPEYIFNVFNESINNTKFKKSFFNVNLLLQNWFIKSSQINPNYVKQYIKLSAKELFNMNNNIITNKDDSIKKVNQINYIGHLTLIFSAFVNYSNIVIEVLNEISNIDIIFQWVKLMFDFSLKIPYEIKVISLSVSSILMKQMNIGLNYNLLLSLSLALLNFQRAVESKNLKKALKNEIKCFFVEEGDDDSDENVDDINEEDSDNTYHFDDEREVKDIIDKTNNSLKNEDEYICFKNVYNNLLKNNPNLITSFVESISQNEKNSLQNILNMHRIIVENNNNNYSIPRKIVKIKRNNNN